MKTKIESDPHTNCCQTTKVYTVHSDVEKKGFYVKSYIHKRIAACHSNWRPDSSSSPIRQYSAQQAPAFYAIHAVEPGRCWSPGRCLATSFMTAGYTALARLRLFR
jgi:hypothetical protein